MRYFKQFKQPKCVSVAHRHARCAKCAYSTDSLPRCKCEQRRRWRCRWYPTATEVVGHIELLGTVAACAVFSSKPPKYPKLLHSICAPAFKDFREIMMATGHRAARVRTNAGESVGCIGLAPTGLLPSSFACSSDPGCKM
jgi:hypothetical protein